MPLLAALAVALVAGTASAAPPTVDDRVPRKERSAAIRFHAPDGRRLVGVPLGNGATRLLREPAFPRLALDFVRQHG